MAPFHLANTWYQSMADTSRPERSAYRVTIASAGGAERHRAADGMEDQRPCEVDQGITDGGHLPVDDRQQARRRLGREQHVVELVVAVEQRRRLPGRTVVVEPAAEAVGRRKIAAVVRGELREPPFDLAFEE